MCQIAHNVWLVKHLAIGLTVCGVPDFQLQRMHHGSVNLRNNVQ